jgi:hypothetical protein
MPLDANRLLVDAERATGFSDWGGQATFEESFRHLFTAMADSLVNEARLTEAGLRGAELRLRAMATSRLQFVNDRQNFPAIADERIVRPIFILGLPRSGSTFLHSLMAQDPANRHPRTWEMLLPSPPPEPSSYENDKRIEQAQTLLRAMGLERPEVTALHPYGARQPEECHLLMELMGLGDNLPALWRMPSFNRVRATIDLRQGYRIHRMALQNLQYRYRCERWLLKNPGHIFYLDHLLAVYPDVQIIQTHRDPARVLPSITALLLAMRQANSDQPFSGAKVAMGNLKAFASGLEKAIEFRRQPGMEQHFHDVHFRSLIADPIGTVQQIYQRFNLTLEAPAVERMQRWLASDDSHSAKTRYTLEQYGLDQGLIDDNFGRYMAQYGVVPERGGR